MLAGAERHLGLDDDRARRIATRGKPRRHDGKGAEVVCADAFLPLLGPVHRGDERRRHLGFRIGRPHGARDCRTIALAGKVRQQLRARLVHALRSELEERGERRIGRVARAHAHVQVAGAAGAHARQAAPAQVEHLPARRAGRDRQRHGGGHRRYLDRGAEHQLRVGDEHLGVQILAVALEPLIVGHLEHHVHVAALAVADAGIAHPAQRHVLPRGHAGRYLHLDRLVAAHAPLAATLAARRLDDASLALAGGTGRNGDELPEERTLRATHFALAGAGGTLLDSGARLRAAASTLVAGVEDAEAQLLLHPRGDLGEGERHGDLHVGAGTWSATTLAASAEQVVEPADPLV